MTESSSPSLWKIIQNPIVILTIMSLLAIAIFTRFYQLDTAPAGGDGDVAWMAIEAVDWVDRGAYPYYVDAAHFPAPVVIALISLSILINGVAIETPRLVTAFGSVLIMLMMLPTAWLLLADDKSVKRRLLVGLSAMAAAATSLHAMNVARLGVNTTVLPIFVTLSLLTAIYAWRYGGIGRWVLAGVCLALTQYIYISAHLMGLVALLWFGHAAIATNAHFRQRWRGWFVMGFTTLLVYLPNLILYLRWSEAFTQRLDTTSVASLEKFIWTHDFSATGGIWVFIANKLFNTAAKVGFPWSSGYLPLSTPVLTPLFFGAWILGLCLCIYRFRRTGYGWVLLALPTLAMADVLTSVAISPNPMRQIALLPFHYLLAGFGLGEILWLIVRYVPKIPQRLIIGLICIIALVPTFTGFYEYITVEIPSDYADPETAWRISQTDLDISNRINSQPTQSYLLPYGEYTRKNMAWLTLAEFRSRHSILSRSGDLILENLPENITVIQAREPQRARHTQTVGLSRPHWWVLLHDGQVFFLPPIDDSQEADLFAAMDTVSPEIIIDASDNQVAEFYMINTPETLFTVPDYTPIDASLSLENASAEIELLGYTVYPTDPLVGEEFEVSLYWQPLTSLARNYEITVQLWDDTATSYGNSQSLPFDSTYRTRVWREDEIIVSHHILFLSDDMPAGRYQLSVALVQHLANQNLVVTGTNASQDRRWVQVDDFRILPEGYTAEARLAGLDSAIQFGDILQLSALDIQLEDEVFAPFDIWQAQANNMLSIALEYDVLQNPALDYSYFIHIIPEDATQPFLQADGALSSVGIPSGAWRVGDSWQLSNQIVFPDDMPSGGYDVWLGVYYYADGSRLAISSEGEIQDDSRLLLGQINVE